MFPRLNVCECVFSCCCFHRMNEYIYNKMLLLSRQRGGKRDPHVLHRQPSRSAPHRSHWVLRRPTLPLHLGDGKTGRVVSRGEDSRCCRGVSVSLCAAFLVRFLWSGLLCESAAASFWRLTDRTRVSVFFFFLLFTFSVVSLSAAVRRHQAAGGGRVQPASQRRE